MPLAITPFGVLPGGEAVEAYTLSNDTGVTVRVLTYGGIIASLQVPDRHGEPADIVLGHDDLDGYLHRSHYFGALIGRFANRIAHGRFVLDGQTYRLATNNGPHHLHGGRRGFDKVVWDATPFETDTAVGVQLAYTSPAGEEGYPGTVVVRTTFTLDAAPVLTITFDAYTDRATPLSLTHHSYFNLGGHASGRITDHRLQIHADRITPTDATLIPTGALAAVAGTPLDLREPTPLASCLDEAHPWLTVAGGIDHNFVLQDPAPDAPSTATPAATLHHPASGRILHVATTEPCLQCYTGQGLMGMRGKEGVRYGPFAGLCLEPQRYPDAPNQPGFPDAILRPGMRYRSTLCYVFAVN